jgi:hypothetical protein
VKNDEPTAVKPVQDQFAFIGKVAGDILKLRPNLHEALA